MVKEQKNNEPEGVNIILKNINSTNKLNQLIFLIKLNHMDENIRR